MRICIYGAGAIGAYLGAKLARHNAAGHDISLVARGAHLDAMRADGLTLIEGDTRETVPVKCTDDPRELGPQDVVIVTLKAHSVAPIVADLATLLGPDTAVVTAQNGVLWWYCHGLEGPLQGHRLQTADPDGRIWDTLGPERAIGCVVYPSYGDCRTGRRPAPRRQPVHARRTRRLKIRARHGAQRGTDERRAQGPGAPQDP